MGQKIGLGLLFDQMLFLHQTSEDSLLGFRFFMGNDGNVFDGIFHTKKKKVNLHIKNTDNKKIIVNKLTL